MCWKHSKYNGFRLVSLFTYSVNWVISDRLLDVFLIAFWVPWTQFFWFLRVWGVGLKINDFLGIPWKGPGWGNTVRWGWKGDRWAHYPLSSLARDYRIQYTTYRIQAYEDVDARMQDWRIRRMWMQGCKIEGYEGWRMQSSYYPSQPCGPSTRGRRIYIWGLINKSVHRQFM